MDCWVHGDGDDILVSADTAILVTQKEVARGGAVEVVGGSDFHIDAALGRVPTTGNPRRVEVNLVTPAVGQQFFVKSQLPVEDMAIVATPTIDHLDGPSAVKRTANKVVECFLGNVDLRHVCQIGGVNSAVVHIGIVVYQTGATSIGVTTRGVLRPNIVPADAEFVARSVGIATGAVAGVGVAEVGAMVAGSDISYPSVIARRNLSMACSRAAAALAQNDRTLLVGTCNGNINITDESVLDIEQDIEQVVCISYGCACREVRECNR